MNKKSEITKKTKMTKTLLTIDEYLQSRASTKNKIISISIAIHGEGDEKEIKRLKELQKAYIEIYNKEKELKMKK